MSGRLGLGPHRFYDLNNKDYDPVRVAENITSTEHTQAMYEVKSFRVEMGLADEIVQMEALYKWEAFEIYHYVIFRSRGQEQPVPRAPDHATAGNDSLLTGGSDFHTAMSQPHESQQQQLTSSQTRNRNRGQGQPYPPARLGTKAAVGTCEDDVGDDRPAQRNRDHSNSREPAPRNNHNRGYSKEPAPRGNHNGNSRGPPPRGSVEGNSSGSPNSHKRCYEAHLSQQELDDEALHKVFTKGSEDALREGLAKGEFGIKEHLATKTAKFMAPTQESEPCPLHSLKRNNYLVDGICVNHNGKPCNAMRNMSSKEREWYAQAWVKKQKEREEKLDGEKE